MVIIIIIPRGWIKDTTGVDHGLLGLGGPVHPSRLIFGWVGLECLAAMSRRSVSSMGECVAASAVSTRRDHAAVRLFRASIQVSIGHPHRTHFCAVGFCMLITYRVPASLKAAARRSLSVRLALP